MREPQPKEIGAAQAAIGRGFDNPVLASQRCFRRILAAMSEPGTVHRLEEPIEAPAGVAAAAAQALLTLADNETPVWLDRPFTHMAPYVRFHCGAPIAERPEAASFALLDGSVAEPGLDRFAAGDERYPDRSATLLVQVAALDGGPRVRLAGPGIQGSRSIGPRGPQPRFWQQAIANCARYPLGIDLILIADEAILCLPRSTRIACGKGGG